MKVKQYVERYNSIPDKDEALSMVVVTMFGEIAEISKVRHCQTNAALRSVIAEMANKWKAFCRAVDPDGTTLKPDGFIPLLIHEVPSTALILAEKPVDPMMLYAAHLASQIVAEASHQRYGK